VEQAVEIDLNALASLGYVSSFETGDSNPKLPDDLEALEEVPIMLARQAPPVNFSVEEIQQQELMSANNSEDGLVQGNVLSSSGGSNASELENMQVGMALLPDNLDVDPGFLSLLE
jgi:hypothetical protein